MSTVTTKTFVDFTGWTPSISHKLVNGTFGTPFSLYIPITQTKAMLDAIAIGLSAFALRFPCSAFLNRAGVDWLGI